MTTGEKIRTLRKELGMTQEELGNKIGVQKAAINKYETGAVVNLKRHIILKLAKALDVSPVWLMDDSPYVPSDKFSLDLNFFNGDAREPELSLDEKTIIESYRSLPPAGKEYVHQQLHAAKALFGEKSDHVPAEKAGDIVR